MAPARFGVSPEAMDYIASMMKFSDQRPGMFPTLHHRLDSRSETEEGETIQYISFEHFQIVWCKPEDLTEYQATDIAGHQIMIHSISLEALDGKRLELRDVRVDHAKSRFAEDYVLVIALVQRQVFDCNVRYQIFDLAWQSPGPRKRSPPGMVRAYQSVTSSEYGEFLRAYLFGLKTTDNE